jgi:glycine oxidase
MRPTDTRTDVLVVGGGVIGLAAAYRLARGGASVRLLDASGTRGASWAAAGMLAPVSEAVFGEDELTRLTVSAVPEFVALATELEEFTSVPVGLRSSGTLAVAFNADDKAALDRLTVYRNSLGLQTERLTGSDTRRLEPYLATGVRGSALATDDLSVDNRRYVQALTRGCELAGVLRVVAEVAALRTTAGGVSATEVGSARQWSAGTVVLCAGAATARFTGLPVYPVKGQILRLSVPERLGSSGPVLGHTVRGLVRGSEVYLVPRADGEVVAGATQEQQGFDTTVTAGGVYELLRNAYELLPVSSEFAFVEALAGLRPGTPDNGPILGWLSGDSFGEAIPTRDHPAAAVDGTRVLVASGHYRNGILLSAATAEAVARLVAGTGPRPEWKPFTPERFHRSGTTHRG